ncbi:unnamed protein product [Spirodela intermedia]|uniref:NECAP PHear domain-containing protein n=1 Tax=Spirodela intermedia TaxID=51605 RepID=A0A7I8J7X4_SPIIN|nr:unnamed protein product [Spirodela intermedia]CAA6665845.1 unnamed protein product [Spirodela intermedia]
MEEEQQLQRPSHSGASEEEEESEAIELVLFHVNECYVYLIPPRMSAASYRADEWNVNKWVWEGSLKVVSRGEECIIKLEDKNTGELYARAFLRKGEPHPVEPVIDSSRYFVLRIEENLGGRLRHAFIGIGFRERSKLMISRLYLDKKKTAEEMEQHFQSNPSVDYSLREGRPCPKSTISEAINSLSLEESSTSKPASVSLKPPPPPPAPVSPVGTSEKPNSTVDPQPKEPSPGQKSEADAVEDDFGDFQAAA